VDFTSNDYLGLASSKDLSHLIHTALQDHGISQNGAGGSRLLSGNSPYTVEVESGLALRFNAESALIFNSGYSANLAVLSSLPERNDTILYDELAHASIIDGARLSVAKRFHFRHNDLNDLELKLRKASGHIFIAVESIYSMDGDECPLVELVELAQRFNATIILDEAHSTGIYGSKGGGLAASLGVERQIPVRIYTFGKAMGIHGACVAGSKRLQQYLLNFARPFIYTTALPAHSIVAIACAFRFLEAHLHLQQVLREKISIFRKNYNGIGIGMSSTSAIQTLVIPGNENARSAAESLRRQGYDVRAILSPTVAPGSERLRICLHTFNSEGEIRDLVDQIKILTTEKHPHKPNLVL
jgi:8-amino-7-oxononanoate synthase